MKGNAVRLGVALGAVVICFASAVAAAPPPAAPTPGQVQSTLPTTTAKPQKGQTPAVNNNAATNAQGVAPGGTAIKVQRFDITGNTVYSSGVLQTQIANYIGQSLTLAQLYDVADVLTRYYRSHGYGLAYVSLPAQTLQGGTVRLEVIEGRVGALNVQGNSHTRSTVLLRRVASLHSGDVYLDTNAERAVMLMNDLPGVQARAVLSPGKEFGTSDVLFDVNENRLSGDISTDDYGRSVIGRWRLNAEVNLNSLTGSGDLLNAGITHSEQNLLNFGKLSYSLPVGAPGSTLTAAYNRAEYHVGGPDFVALHISGSTVNGALNWQYESLRTQEQSFYWGFGFTHNTSRTFTGAGNVPTTDINLLQLTSYYTQNFDDQSYYTLSGNAWSNGKANDSTPNINAERLRLELDTTYVKPMQGSWAFIGQLSLEYSAEGLTDSDKFSLGGPGSVRGFQSAEARGDSGMFASAELQRTFNSGSSFPLAWGVYLDNGQVWNKSVGGANGTNTVLTSVGTELQLLPSITNSWNARLQWAWAFGNTPPSDGGNGGHIWFTLGTTF